MKNKIKDKKFLIKNLKKTPIIQFACERSGIARATFYRWKIKDKKFAKEAGRAIREGVKFVNDMAESQLLAAIKDKNMTAIIFWLKNHNINYRERLDITAKHKISGGKLSKEQEKIIKRALKLVTILPKGGKNATKK